MTSSITSPNSQHVIYLADQDTSGVQQLYSVPLGGGVVAKLNGTLVSGGQVEDVFLISPNSQRVVYVADQDTGGVNELYSVPLSGGPQPN